MNTATEIAELFARDLTRLAQELRAFTNDADLWRSVPGMSNSAGNLALHLEGNLREFIGRQLGGVPYERKRDLEFSSRDIPAAELMRRIEEIAGMIPRVIAGLSASQLESAFPVNIFSRTLSTQQTILSLYGHLNYHLGQIDCLRRVLTQSSAIEFAGL
jgi:hypothetical protein